MLQHRLLGSFRDHDWLTSTVEFVLLTLGIFFGFQMDRWNDVRLDQNEANEYSIQLLADLTREQEVVEHGVDYYRQVRSFGEKALTAWQETPEASAEELVIAFYQASNILALSSERGAYDVLSSKGLIHLVGNPEFGSELSQYYAQIMNPILSQQPAYRLNLRGVMPNQIQQAIRKNCSKITAKGRLIETLLDSCAIGLSEIQAKNAIASIIEHPLMKFYLRQYISKASVNIYIMEPHIQEIKELREKLIRFQK